MLNVRQIPTIGVHYVNTCTKLEALHRWLPVQISHPCLFCLIRYVIWSRVNLYTVSNGWALLFQHYTEEMLRQRESTCEWMDGCTLQLARDRIFILILGMSSKSVVEMVSMPWVDGWFYLGVCLDSISTSSYRQDDYIAVIEQNKLIVIIIEQVGVQYTNIYSYFDRIYSH